MDVWDFNCRLCGSALLPLRGWCVICDGNVARAERLKRELGTKVRYSGTAARVHRDYFLGASFLMELYRRMSPLKPPKALVSWVSREDCYSIDAPELIPAGGCFAQHVPDAADEEDPDPSYPAQITISRESSC